MAAPLVMGGVLVIAVGSALGLWGCGGDDSAEGTGANSNNGTGGTGGSGGTSGAGGASGVGGSGIADAGGDGDASGGSGASSGMNDSFVTGHDCSVWDVDRNGDSVMMICGQRLALFTPNPADLLATVQPSFLSESIASSVSGQGEVRPRNLFALKDEHRAVAFSIGEDDGTSYLLGGIAFISPSGCVMSNFVGKEGISDDFGQKIFPRNITSGAMIALTGQDHLFIPAAIDHAGSDAHGNGMVLSYGLETRTCGDDSGVMNLDQNSIKLPIFTSGKDPVAITRLPDETLLVVNARGGLASWQLSNASMDIVTPTVEDGGAVDPGYAIVRPSNVIDLGVPFAARLPELAMTDDGRYAVVAGGTDEMHLSKILVVDVAGRQVTGWLDLATVAGLSAGTVRDITVRDSRIYVSYELDDGGSAPTGKIAVIDFSNPASPVFEEAQDLGYGVGATEVVFSPDEQHRIVMGAVTDLASEMPGSAIEPYMHVVAYDPDFVPLSGDDAGTDVGVDDASSDN